MYMSFARIVYAQPPALTKTNTTITPEPVGSGARALGQSAFIAVADDATAASWNPAGLINLERPEVSFVGAWRTAKNDNSPEDARILIDQASWSESQINFMSYAQPVEIGNTDVVISVNYHQVYNFGTEFDVWTPIPNSNFLLKEEGESEGAVSAYSLAGGLSMPSYPELSIGASFNWYTQSLLNNYAWKIKKAGEIWLHPPSGASSPIPGLSLNTTETIDNFRGYNFTFGLLWDVYERQENLLTLGLVYHTPFTAKMERKFDVIISGVPVPFPQEDMDIDMPASLGAGVNYRISDTLSIAFDVEWKEWSKFKQKYADGTSDSPYDSNTLAYRLGFEQLTFSGGLRESVFAYRGGLFYEPRPVLNYPDDLPVYGLSAGLGWTIKDRYSLDFAYQFRWGNEDVGDIDYDIEEHFFVGSLIIYF